MGWIGERGHEYETTLKIIPHKERKRRSNRCHINARLFRIKALFHFDKGFVVFGTQLMKSKHFQLSPGLQFWVQSILIYKKRKKGKAQHICNLGDPK